MLMKYLNLVCLEIQLCQLSFRLSQREKLLNGKLCTYFDLFFVDIGQWAHSQKFSNITVMFTIVYFVA